MNWNQFRKNVGWRFQLAPLAQSIDPLGNEIATPEFDDWIFDEVTDNEAIRIKRIWSGHIATLGKDWIFDFRTDPERTRSGISYGFLTLKMQLVIVGPNVKYVPNAKPGERAYYQRPVQPAKAPQPAQAQPSKLRGYTAATVPAASAHRGEFILVTDPLNWEQAMLYFSDSNRWQVVKGEELPY